MYPAIRLGLPAWIAEVVGARDRAFVTPEEKMGLAIGLARRNVEEGSGGPFGACIFESETGRLVAPGVNLVVVSRCSVAHAEAMAIMIAQRVLGTFDLGPANLELHSSAQPCIQCFGVIWWSGLRRVVTGATGQDVEETGFREGPLPEDWAARLSHRPPLPPVEVVTECLRPAARAVLREYRDRGGPIYNPGQQVPP